MKIIIFLGALFLFCFSTKAQDAHFTQFNSTPIFLNPAMTGVFLNYHKGHEKNLENSSRLITNTRSQWSGNQSSYNSAFLQFDKRMSKQYGPQNYNIESPFNLGVSCLYDQSLLGALKNTTISFSGSYQLLLSENVSSLGIGASFSYTNRILDLSKISFSNQFTSGGFNLDLPSGENALSNMKPFLSIGTGLLYRYEGEDGSNFLNVGISALNVNKPKQTFYTDDKQFLPIRYTAQANWTHIYEKFKIESYIFYQNQASINEMMGGVVLDYFLTYNDGIPDKLIGMGFSYRHKDAISPYLRFEIKNFMIGCSYDITTSNLSLTSQTPKSFELSLQCLFKNNNQ